ncbi:MAG: hypothetical protein U9Q88_05640 [Bacillota bacterium]|nr:hypothetical protein [Bacillota bacterium]
MQTIVKKMSSEAEIMSTFSTFKQLRPQLNEKDFLEKIIRLKKNNGFQYGRVAYLEMENSIKPNSDIVIDGTLPPEQKFYRC